MRNLRNAGTSILLVVTTVLLTLTAVIVAQPPS